MKNNLLLFIMVLLYLFPSKVSSQLISDEKLYHRCYSHIVQKRVKANDQRLLAIKTGKKTGQTACGELLQLATLSSNHELNLNQHENLLASNILGTFQRLHNQWILTNSSQSITGLEKEIFDLTALGSHFTMAMFSPQFSFREIFLTESIYEPKRLIPANQKDDYFTYTRDNNSQLEQRNPATYNIGLEHSQTWKVSFYEKGRLIGLTDNRSNELPGPLGLTNIHQNVFGKTGILGDPLYLLLNVKRLSYIDGGIFTYRNFSKSVLNNFLCKSQPTLNKVVLNQNQLAKNPLPFYRENNCIGCHTSLDSLAGLVRNLKFNNVGLTLSSGQKEILSYPLNIPHSNPQKESPLLSSRSDFHSRPPYGKFIYQTLKGTLINKQFSGLEEFSSYLSEFDDTYTCMAKKYFHFFTNINIDIHKQNQSPKEIELTNFLINLGQELKGHQSLQKMIHSIWRSPYYLDMNYGGNI